MYRAFLLIASMYAGAAVLPGSATAALPDRPLLLAKAQQLPPPGSIVQDEAPPTHEQWVELTRAFAEHYRHGNLRAAAETAGKALKFALREYGEDHPFTADSVNKLGLVNEAVGRLDTAIQLYGRAVAILEKHAADFPAELGNALNNLANAVVQSEDYARGETLHLRALQARMRAHGAEHAAVAESAYNLGIVYQKTSQRDNAELFFKQAAALWSQSDDAPAAINAANSYTRLAEIYTADDNHAGAEQLHLRALELRRAHLDSNDVAIAESMIGVARACIKQEKYDAAGPLYRQALDIMENQLGPDDPRVAVTLYSLANVYHIQAKIEDAYNRDFAARIAPDKTPANGPARSDVLRGQIELHKHFVQDLYVRAEPLYVRAAAIIKASFGAEHPTLKLIDSELSMLRNALHSTNALLHVR